MPKKKAARKNGKAETGPSARQEITAIVLIAVSLLLIIAFFGAGGALTGGIVKGLRTVVGLATYALPVALVLMAVNLFMKKDEAGRTGWIGVAIVITAFAGLLQTMVNQDQTLQIAQDGKGGGFVGYLVSSGLLNFLSTVSVAILLIALILIGLVLSLDLKFSEVFAKIVALIRSKPDEDIATQLGENAIQMPKINAKVPLVTGRSEAAGEPIRDEPEVLTTPSDPDWTLPSLDLLEDKKGEADAGKPQENAQIIAQTLGNFGIKVSVEEINIGPTVTQYALKPDSSVRLSKITELANNLELSLAAHPIRMEAPIPGKSMVGIEVPNRKAAIVRLKEILTTDSWQDQSKALPFALGLDISGQPVVASLDTMPHLLIAGATGSGKSVMINSLILSLMYRYSPADLKLILVDPKQVELKPYDDIPHLLAPVITDPEKCISALKWSVAEMERRYTLFAEKGKRNIAEYNNAIKEAHMPYITIIIDELADLMMMAPQDTESLIVRIAQKARATGIHLVVATQRPSVNIITGLIKANVPARIAFSTVSQVDSRTIIDQAGSEKLLGKGDMLFLAPDVVKPRRMQGVFVSEKEIKGVADFLRNARAPAYNEEVLTQSVRMGGSGRVPVDDWEGGDDSLLMDAARLVIESRKASASLLQRRLRVGYARAARLLDMLEERGIVSAPDGSRPRDILVDSLSEVSGEHDEAAS